ncbi:hypothetical protein FOC1_g10001613 [Fusarium oxysporum f. sp. cubense race 1]|uniref:DUF7732 domain-containing protein n=1 Tax=Fusarium oxysporum f. sp. cubense (strain race 1) TaxID=1229664 RepID=N4UWE7_FUSC1|nr:hypothetical protein FOC1_g10001613 [Fusarium oxysporum f. sp. cubense race 1]
MSTTTDSLSPERVEPGPCAETHPLNKRRGGSHGGGRGRARGSGSQSSHGFTGVGPQPTFADGRYYAGGSVRPFKAGAASPGGIRHYLMDRAAVLFWPDTCSSHNETIEEDDPGSALYFKELIGSGSYEALNKSIVDGAELNDTKTILTNATLPNGTALAGDEDINSASARRVVGTFGNWPTVAVIVGTVLIS